MDICSLDVDNKYVHLLLQCNVVGQLSVNPAEIAFIQLLEQLSFMALCSYKEINCNLKQPKKK